MTEEEGKTVERKEEKVEPLKKGALRDDLWEDLAIRHSVSKAGGDEDSSCRVYPEYDEETGKAKFTSAGKPGVLETFDKGLRTKQIKHEKLEVEKYPGDEGFPAEKAKEIAAPRIARTIGGIRGETPLPKPPWEDKVTEKEDKAIEDVSRLLGLGQKTEEEAKQEGSQIEETKEEQAKATLEGFTPKFEKSD